MAPAQIAPAQMRPAQMTPAATVAEPVASEEEQHAGFVTRWPDNLPNAEDMDQQEPARRNSYAETPQATEATAQMPSPWPVAVAAQTSAGETALRYFSVAGIVAIPLLLVAGWAAKFSRRPWHLSVRERWRAIAGRLRRRRFVDIAPMGRAASAAAAKHSKPERWTRTPTDPARDLKASLAELMRDLRRAGAFEPEDPAHQTKASAYYAALEAAE
jgi:hypothetical protein